LALTVLPAPDSPDTTMVWFFSSRNMSLTWDQCVLKLKRNDGQK
jgi:hypothetical protein